MVEGGGFEPPKDEPSDLQSDPFGRSGTPPLKQGIFRNSETNVNIKSRLFTELAHNCTPTLEEDKKSALVNPP